MKRFIKIFNKLILSVLFVQCSIINADCATSPVQFFELQSLCSNPCCVAGSFTTNGDQPVTLPSDPFCVQRIANGFYAVTLKQAFCCPISVVARAEIKNPSGCSASFSKSYPVNGNGPFRLAVSLDRKCLAVSNNFSDSVSVLPIMPGCILGTAVTKQLPFGSQPLGLTYSSDCLAVTNNGTDTISVFTKSGCDLSNRKDTNSNGEGPASVSFSPITGKCLAVSNSDQNLPATPPNVSIFSINSCTPSSPQPIVQTDLPAFSQSATFLSDHCLAVLTTSSMGVRQISLYSVSDTCIPDTLPAHVISKDVGSSPSSIAFSAANNCLAVSNFGDSTISVFQVTSLEEGKCNLIEVAGSPFTVKNNPGFGPIALDYSPDGTCLAVLNAILSVNPSTNISMFSVNPSICGLSPVGIPLNLPTVSTDIKFLSNGCLATADSNTNNVTVFNVNAGFSMPIEICQAMTPGCFILQLLLPEGQSDAGITVNFFATQCT